jgi:hypothetical protein
MERQLFVNQKTSALYDVRFQENWNKVVNYFICWRSEATRLKGEEMIASSTDRQGEEMQNAIDQVYEVKERKEDTASKPDIGYKV